MSILRRMLNAIGSSGSDGAGLGGGAVPADLKRLDIKTPGLSPRVYAYIEGHGDPIVLASLGQTGSWLSGGRYAHAKDNPGVEKRREVFSNDQMDPAWIARYVEVLAADGANNGYSYGYFKASDAVPAGVRIFLSELKHRPTRAVKPGEPPPWPMLSADHIMDIVTRLGGQIEDVLDVIFFQDSGYHGRNDGLQLASVFDLDGLIQGAPDAFVRVGARLPVLGRCELLNYVARKGLVETPPFSGLVIDGLGDSAKAIREAAFNAFAKADPARRIAFATERLAAGSADMRASMVDVLIAVGGPIAREKLEAHLNVEKTARVRATIEGYLQATGSEPAPATSSDGETTPGFRAVDGSFVAIPPLAPLEPVLPALVSAETKAELLAIGKQKEETYQRDLAAEKQPYYIRYAASLLPEAFAKAAEDCILGMGLPKLEEKEARRRVQSAEFRAWLAAYRNSQPLAQSIDLLLFDMTGGLLPGYSSNDGRGFVQIAKLLAQEAGFDLRHLEAAIVAKGLRTAVIGPDFATRDRRPGELAFHLFLQFGFDRRSYESRVEGIPPRATWPLVAENLWLVDHALGLVSDAVFKENRAGALDMLAVLPKLPAKYATLLLDMALTAPKDLRKAATTILKRNEGYEAQVVALLSDSRQDIRAAAAKWLGDVVHAPAVPALQKQLKAEKSVVAKSAILSALGVLGQDLSAHLGPAALLAEAKAGLPKASFKDADWLDLTALPPARYRDGSPVPAEVVQWWVALALKLKTPGDTGLFDLYLDQLDQDDTARLSTYLFDAWLGEDVRHPTQAEADAHAQANFAQVSGWWRKYYDGRKDWTDDQILAQLRRDKLAETPYSAAPAKGLLSLGGRVPSSHAVAKVRSYLRKHGGRTSQSLSLLELMAARGDAMSLQVVIAAATRLRQKGVQAKAAEMVQAIADRNDWTLDQLADRTVPTGGLDDDGTLDLPCAGGDKVYVAKLDDALGLALFNPEGKPVKSLPSGQDEETQASAKALSAAKKEIKQAVDFQTARLFEAMCCGRSWTVEDWTRDFHGHPLMRKLVERLIWQGLDPAGAPLGSFRPTPEGDFVDTADADVAHSGFAGLRLAHASTLTEGEGAAWRKHMKDYAVTPLFDQVRLDLPRLTDAQRDLTEIDDRKGWVYDAFTLRGEAGRAGYERGAALDGGGFDCYIRHFGSVGIVAVVEFTGNHVEQENIPVALKTLYFERLAPGQTRTYGSGQKLKLGQIPPVLLAECHADLHRIAKKASFDPDWEKVALW